MGTSRVSVGYSKTRPLPSADLSFFTQPVLMDAFAAPPQCANSDLMLSLDSVAPQNMPEASATAPLAAWSSNDPRLTRAPRVLRAAQERGTTSAATRDDGAQGALPTGTSDATRCTRRRAVLASLGCARTRLLTPSALREQHASAAKKLCPSKVRRIVLYPRQRFSCLTRAAKASCARCGCDFHQTAARGAQARVCSSKRQRNLAEVTRPVPGATIPAALSMDCSAAPSGTEQQRSTSA
jgi:hypothetical protein